MLRRGWGAGTSTFAGRAKGGNVQVDFHDRLKGYSLSRRVQTIGYPRSQRKDAEALLVTRDTRDHWLCTELGYSQSASRSASYLLLRVSSAPNSLD
jgi:hypothetical protein